MDRDGVYISDKMKQKMNTLLAEDLAGGYEIGNSAPRF